MSVDLKNSYLEACIRHGEASEAGDHKEANKAYKDLMKVLQNMRKTPDQGVGDLISLLEEQNPNVICWAATHLLPMREDLAKQHLGRLAAGEESLAGLNAKMVLQEWGAGRLRVE